MKKVVVSIFLMASMVSVNSFAQSSSSKNNPIYSDVNFLKANLHLFSIVVALDEVQNASNQENEKKRVLPVVKSSIDETKRLYNLVKSKSYSESEMKAFEQHVLVIERTLEMLKSKDPSWVLAYTLVKMNLTELVEKNIK